MRISALEDVARKLKRQGKAVLKRATAVRGPFAYPHTLGSALLVAAGLCKLAGSNDRPDMASLFDGGEDSGPNAYTMIKCVRDLCSAALWAASVQEHQSRKCSARKRPLYPRQPLARLWRDIVRKHANQVERETAAEAAQLLDDMFESLLCIAEWLRMAKPIGRCAWSEIHRHIVHVRDHFDYAEHALIALLKEGTEVPLQKRRKRRPGRVRGNPCPKGSWAC